jgi:hypothetical protein
MRGAAKGEVQGGPLERTDTIPKQAVIVVEAGSAAEARQWIAYDVDVDAGAYHWSLLWRAQDR